MPCYYQNNVIKLGIEKLIAQTYKDNLTLIMINDCSTNTQCEYQDLINTYKEQIHIEYIKTSNNIGPGCVRQLGIDKSQHSFLLFQDDDDELFDTNSIELLVSQLNNKDITTIASVSGDIQLIS